MPRLDSPRADSPGPLNPRGADKTPVLAFGRTINTLSVLRIFERQGIRAIVLPYEKNDFLVSSRWYRTIPTLPEHSPRPSELAEFLRSLHLGRAVLMPCGDDWAMAIAALDPALQERFPAPVAGPDAVGVLLDKARFAEVLERLKIPHPRTTRIDSVEDLQGLPDEHFVNAFFKPRDSWTFRHLTGKKAIPIRGRAEAIAQFHELRKTGVGLLLQEFIPGPAGVHHYIEGFVDRHGRFCGVFARRRMRIYPPAFGASTYTVSIPLREVAGQKENLERLFDAIKYRGIFSAEFKFDERDGLFKIIEVNARPWWYVGFAYRCGVNVLRMAYDDALGLSPQPVMDYSLDQGCIYAYYDWRTIVPSLRDRQLTMRSWLRSWVRSSELTFEWDDPAPAIRLFIALAREEADRRLRR